MDSTRSFARTRLWTLIASAVVVTLMLALASTAQANISITSVTAKPASTAAGANSNFVVTVNFAAPVNSGDTDFAKNVTIHLPPGQVANPRATPLCTVSQLNAANCPSATQVGAVHTEVTIAGLVQQAVDGKIFNLTPQAGEPARFGIILRPSVGSPIILQSAAKLRPTDYGLDSVLNGIPSSAMGLSTHIDTMEVTLFGKAGGNAFSRNPTSCSPATTSVDATAYGGSTSTKSTSYTPTNCSALDFSPTFSSNIGSKGHTAATTHPPLSTVVDQDSGEAGVRDVTAILPKGIGADANALVNRCPLASFQAGTCPANTVVGDATAESPYLTQPLHGPVTIVESAPGQTLPRLGLDLQGPLHIQLFGSFVLSPSGPGNAFIDIPDIPLSHFVLQFAPDGLVATSRDLCKGSAPTFQTSFTGWNGATQSGNVAAKVQGCAGGGGGGGGKPKGKAKVTHAASGKPNLKLAVTDKAKIAQETVKLPKSLRLAKGKALRHGVKVKGGTVVKASGRTLKVKGKKGSRVVAKAVNGALLRTKTVANKKLRFKVVVKDGASKTTKLTLVAKAKP